MISGKSREVHLRKYCCSHLDVPFNRLRLLVQIENANCCVPPLSPSEIEGIVLGEYKDLHVLSADSILSSEIPPIPWLIDDFLCPGLFFIAGRKGIGKSWFVLQLSVCILNQERFLGRYSCHPSRILYCALEDTLPRLKGRLSYYKVQDVSQFHFIFMDEIPRMLSGGLSLLQSHLNRYRDCKLIIIDTLARFRSVTNRTRNLYQEDYDMMSYLQSFAMQNDVTLLVVHHLNKGIHLNSEVDSISGTVGVIGSADGLHILREVEKGFVNLYSTGREIKEESLALNLNKETMQWEYLGNSRLLFQSEIRKLICQFVEDSDKPPTMTEISKGLNKNHSTISTIVGKMVREGTLCKENKTYQIPMSLF